MGRTRSLALVAIMSVPLVHVVYLACAPTALGDLPDTGWTALGPVLGRTALVAGPAGLLGSLAGGVLAAAARVVPRGRGVLLAAGGVLLALPPVIIARALSTLTSPDGLAILVAAQALASLPIAFLVQVAALTTVDDEDLLTAASLGVPAMSAVRRLVLPVWWRALWISWAVTSLLAASDPSVSLVYGGTDSLLASHAFHAVVGGVPAATPARVILVLAVPTFLLAGYVLSHRVRWSWVGTAIVTRSQHAVARYLRGFSPLLVLVVAVVAVVAGVLALLVAGAVREDPEPAAMTPILTTLAVAVVVVPLSGLLGLMTADWSRGRRAGLLHGAMLAVLLAPTGVGIFLVLVHRDAVVLGTVPLLPPLVGGAALAQGMVAVVAAYLSVTVPIAHFAMAFVLARSSDVIEAATAAGAGPLRVRLTVVLPAMWLHLVAVMVFLGGVVLTRVAPVIFVQPPGVQLTAPTLVTRTGAGQTAGLFTMSLTAAALAAVAFLLAAAVARAAVRPGAVDGP